MDTEDYYMKFGLLAICVAQAIRKAMFENYVLTSDMISASELNYTLDMAILNALHGMFAMQSQKEIDAAWRQDMEFIKTVTTRV